jgi:calcineurin-like phosphoesterase family protein
MTWFTSDTHGYHKNICKGTSQWGDTGEQRTRDFNTPEEMTQEIIKTFNKYVQYDDVLYFLGDWTFAGFDNIKRLRDQINCQIIHFIFGNHDHHIENNKEGIQSIFSSVQHVKTITIEGHRVFMSHYSHQVWDKSHKGQIHLFGHSHDTLKGIGKSMDVGVDVAFRLFGEYRPFSWPEIQSIMAKKEVELVDHHTKNTN